MGKPKHDLEELRGKVKTGAYIGVRQLAFVFEHLDAAVARAEKSETQCRILIDELLGDTRCPDHGQCRSGKRALWAGRAPDEQCVACWQEWSSAEAEKEHGHDQQ